MFQISEVLKKVPFFQNMERAGIDFVIENLKFKPFEINEVICQAEDPGVFSVGQGNTRRRAGASMILFALYMEKRV